jgi:sigma-B regulation protein RsbU (phosphoserine phosphatase)
MFATAFFGVLDPARGTLDYVNAGHELPVVLGAGSRVRARLAPTGPALGLMPGLAFAAATETLGAGETLFAFTDGVVDARDAGDDPYGEERLMAMLEQGGDADALLARVDSALDAHAAGTSPFDDVAMLAARRLP